MIGKRICTAGRGNFSTQPIGYVHHIPLTAMRHSLELSGVEHRERRFAHLSQMWIAS